MRAYSEQARGVEIRPNYVNVHATQDVTTHPRRKVGRDVLVVVLVGFAACLPFLLAPFRAMILGPSGRGEFAFFQSSVSIIGLASTLGLRLACYQLGLLGAGRFAIRYGSLTIASMLCGAVVAIPAALVAFNSFSSQVGYFILASQVLCVGYAFNQLETANAQRFQLRRRIVASTAIPALVEFVANMLLIVLQRLNLVVGMLVTFLAEATRGAMAVVWNRRDRCSVESPPVNTSNMAIFRASLLCAPAAVVPLLSGNLDVVAYGAVVESASLGHYVIAKLGFSAMLVAGTVLEGRAIGLFARVGLARAISASGLLGAALASIGGALGWALTPIIFGPDFVESADAFPVAAGAGFLAYMFISLNAISSHLGTPNRLAGVLPGLLVLLGIVMSSLIVPVVFGSSVIAMTAGLLGSQLLGVITITVFLLAKWRKNRA